jgi:hypothetical protein
MSLQTVTYTILVCDNPECPRNQVIGSLSPIPKSWFSVGMRNYCSKKCLETRSGGKDNVDYSRDMVQM